MDWSALTVEARDALLMAPVGTPGLADLGLTNVDDADLLNPGASHIERALGRRAHWRAAAVAEGIVSLSPEERQLLAAMIAEGKV